MIGAILGDIIGSRFEFRPTLTKDFELFTKESHFTDDTVMLIAVADALINNQRVDESLKGWYSRYPDKMYGPNFRLWAEGKRASKKSIGNGAMVRLASLPFIAIDLTELEKIVVDITKLTHNSKEAKQSALTAMHYAHSLIGSTTKTLTYSIIQKYQI